MGGQPRASDAGDAIFEGLNTEQRQAVEAVTGPVCIVAGAGTGKTTTITRRLAHQVASGAFAPDSLLAVTFTDKAATEMRARLRRLGVAGIRASTFHAAALSQLHHFGSAPVGRVLGHKGTMLAPLVRSLPKPFRFVPVADIAGEIEWAKNQRIGPDAYRSSLRDHEPPIPADLMHRTFLRYEERKRQQGAIDFEDMLDLAIRTFDDVETVRAFVAEHQAFTVDEYQDVNLLQQTLLERWLDGRDEICVVGDDYQAIYSFTGATPRHLLRFPDRFDTTRVLNLSINYRSSPQVLELANRLAPRLGGMRKQLRASRADGPRPVVRAFASSDSEHAFIAAEIARLNHDGIAYDDIAILYRTNARAEDYEELLSAKGIPYQLRDDGLLERPAARQLRPRLRDLRSTAVAATLRRVAASLGYDPDAAADVGRQEYTRQKDLDRFVRLAEDFDDGTRSLGEFVAEMGRRFGQDDDASGVNLLTLHKAKGLEFEVVFVPKVERNELPHRRADTSEERRLFYVALTRAKRHLYVTSAEAAGRGRSIFIEELGEPAVAPRLATQAQGTGSPAGGADDAVDELMAELKRWRRERAAADGVPAYVVAHDATLADIARRQPRATRELAAIRGIGQTKVDRYGEEILEVIRRAR